MSNPSDNQASTPHLQGVSWANPQRQQQFQQWLDALPPDWGLQTDSLQSASADASFRRYLRIQGGRGSLVIMDAPPDKEDCKPFVQVARLMQQAGLRVPQVLAWDEAHGFLLLSDLGTQTLLQGMDLQAPPPLHWYLDAVDLLVQWQQASRPGVLPPYDAVLLRRELDLYPNWYVAQHRQVTLNPAQQKTLEDAFALILANNLSWPSGLCSPRLHAAQLDAVGTGPGRAGFSGCGLWPHHLRHCQPAARRLP